MVLIINNIVCDKSNECLDLFAITIYRDNTKNKKLKVGD